MGDIQNIHRWREEERIEVEREECTAGRHDRLEVGRWSIAQFLPNVSPECFGLGLFLGASTSWNFNGGAATFARNLAAEVTPIENWLELEAGVSPFYSHKSTERDTDLLFKKPWTIPTLRFCQIRIPLQSMSDQVNSDRVSVQFLFQDDVHAMPADNSPASPDSSVSLTRILLVDDWRCEEKPADVPKAK
jgi:hypothetical protein